MNKLFVITGPAGVGKSTISSKIAESLEKSCLIEGDDIYHFVKGGYVNPWKQGNHLDLFWQNSINIISNCLNSGYDVVFNYIIDNKAIAKVKKSLPNATLKFVVLMVDEKTIIKRDKERPSDCQMGERSLILLKKMKDENFNKKFILDTSNLTIKQTVGTILSEDRFLYN